MSLRLTCPEFIYRSVTLEQGDILDISVRVGNNNALKIQVIDNGANTFFSTSGESGQFKYQYTAAANRDIIIKAFPEEGEILIAEILLCNKKLKNCNLNKIKNLRAFIEYDGTPGQPVNIFNAFARVIYRTNGQRTVQNLRVLQTSRSSLTVPTDCTKAGVCDLWKSQVPGTNILSNQLSDFAIGSARKGQTINITAKSNWLWSIPASSKPVGQDFLTATLMDANTDPLQGVVESIEIFILANKITYETPETGKLCSSYCQPNPANVFSVTITYERDTQVGTTNKSFTLLKNLNEIYNIDVPTEGNPDTPWDTLATFDFGQKGYLANQNAQWTTVAFVLDRTNGKGLDQCTDPVIPSIISGDADVNIPTVKADAVAVFQSKCDAEVRLNTVQEGSSQNHQTSIRLPSTTGGTWSLSLQVGSGLQTSNNIPYNASANRVASALASIPYIGELHNVRVTGTYNTEYIVEFVGEFAGSFFPTLIANSDNLVGASSFSVRRTQTGTNNDKQQIRKVSASTTSPFTLQILGQTTSEIRHDVSLLELQTIITALEVVGDGDVLVTGNTTSATANFEGPWQIEFRNALGGINIPLMASSNPGYQITKQSTGGIGLNEKHEIRYRCTGGTFTLLFRNPSNETIIDGLIDVPFDIDDIDLYNLLTSEIPWFTAADLGVTLSLIDDLRIFTIEYKGAYAKQGMPLPSFDGTKLKGGRITITTVTEGFGTPEITNMVILKARAGSFKLTINGLSTSSIPYNTTADGLRDQLKQLANLQYANVQVTQPSGTTYIINTGVQAGNVTVAANYASTLLCDPLFLPPVPEPDYPYPIPPCDDQFEDYTLMFKGALFCDPGDPYPEPPVVPGILDTNANIARTYDIQRDLYSPDFTVNSEAPTAKHLARLKNIPTDSFTAYLNESGTLTQVSWNYIVNNQSSIVFVSNEIEDISKIKQQLNASPILPSRMKWPV